MKTNPSDLKKTIEIMRGFNTAMLVTHDSVNEPRARPMHIADVEDSGAIWFVSHRGSGKNDEIQTDSRVGLTLQSKTQYVSVSGRAREVDDRAKLKALWNKSWDLWFDGGPEDSSAVLLLIAPERVEYWDMSGTEGLRFFWEAAKAYVTGDTIDRNATSGSHGEARV